MATWSDGKYIAMATADYDVKVITAHAVDYSALVPATFADIEMIIRRHV